MHCGCTCAICFADFSSRCVTTLQRRAQHPQCSKNLERCPSCWQASKMHAFRFFGQQQVSTYSSQVKSSDAKPRSRVESSRIQSSQVKSSQVNSSQVKSAAGPTPIREPNVRAEAEKKNIFIYVCIYIHQKLYNHRRLSENVKAVFDMKQKSRKHGSRESHRTAFLETLSRLPKALYLQSISNLASQAYCGRPQEGYIGTGFHASALLTRRSAGKLAM